MHFVLRIPVVILIFFAIIFSDTVLSAEVRCDEEGGHPSVALSRDLQRQRRALVTRELITAADHNEQVKASGTGGQWEDLREEAAIKKEQRVIEAIRAHQLAKAVDAFKASYAKREEVQVEEERDRQQLEARQMRESKRPRTQQSEQNMSNLDDNVFKMMSQSA